MKPARAVMTNTNARPVVALVRSANHDDTIVGRTIGRYEVVARIGAGSMGRVYKARDRRLQRWVALKFLPLKCDGDETAYQRFVLEAQLASRLNHPNICAIHSIESTEDGRPFIVMAFYEGKTLKQLLEAGHPVPVSQALALGRQIADGLAEIHEHSIVHGDLKASNLLVTDQGLKILDFGLAISTDDPKVSCNAISTPGTLPYAAPEQTRGEKVDPRTDIWAAGVTLYEMLTNHMPFAGDYREAMSYAIRHDPPTPMQSWGINIPTSVERLVLKALEKDPARRFQTARDLEQEVRTLQASTTSQDTPYVVGCASMIGQIVSHYHITGKLGVGGMGVVYEAQDTRCPRRVALKFISETLAEDRDALRRLKREATLIAQLNHPHICAVYETAEYHGRVCIVMERLEGTNLKLHLLRHALTTSEIVDIALQVADALEKVHMLGIVHRDVKPGNIFIDPAGVVKVLDFGLARRFQIDDSDTTLGGSSIPGKPFGTPNYMAPERILQQPLDPRSDLFSLGVVMYEMATERLPFGAPSTMETIENVLDKDPVPLRAVSPGRPTSLERVIGTLLAKQADQRFQSAMALKRALLDIRSDEPLRIMAASNAAALEEGRAYGAVWRPWA